MLDLSIKHKPTMDIALENGEIVKILPPKRVLFTELNKLDSGVEIGYMYSLVASILSNNTVGKTYSDNDVEIFDIEDLHSIIDGYTEFIVTIQKN